MHEGALNCTRHVLAPMRCSGTPGQDGPTRSQKHSALHGKDPMSEADAIAKQTRLSHSDIQRPLPRSGTPKRKRGA